MAKGVVSVPRLQALDTNTMFRLAKDSPGTRDAIKRLQGLGCRFVITDRVFAELVNFAMNGNAEEMKYSNIALDAMPAWEIEHLALTPSQKKACENFENFAYVRKLLPVLENNDRRILAEAGACEIPILVTADSGIFAAKAEKLKQTFIDSGLPPVTVIEMDKLCEGVARRSR